MAAPYSEMDPVALERDYSPSMCVPSVDPYLAAYATKTTRARVTLGVREYAYGVDGDEVVDFYPVSTPGAGLLVFIHGGYWQELGRADSGFMALDLAAQGVATAVPEYTLCPAATLMEIVQQTRRAVRFVCSQAAAWRVDSQRIWLAGHSAGAHLAAMCLLDPVTAAGLEGAILIGGVYDLEPLVYTSVNDVVGMSIDDARRLSPSRLVGPGLKPIITMVGRNEPAAFHRQSAEFAAAWAGPGALNDARPSVIVNGRNHFDLPMDLGKPDTVLGHACLTALGAL